MGFGGFSAGTGMPDGDQAGDPRCLQAGKQQGGIEMTVATARSRRVDELRTRIAHDAYVVDPKAVAEALLRLDAPRRALTPPVSRRDAHGRPGAASPRRPSCPRPLRRPRAPPRRPRPRAPTPRRAGGTRTARSPRPRSRRARA